MILITVKIIVNQQSCIFYILWCNHCTTDISLCMYKLVVLS